MHPSFFMHVLDAFEEMDRKFDYKLKGKALCVNLIFVEVGVELPLLVQQTIEVASFLISERQHDLLGICDLKNVYEFDDIGISS